MSGHIVKRGSKYSVVIELGTDSNGKRLQKWYSGFADSETADNELVRILHEMHTGQFMEPQKLTVAAWLDYWLKNYCVHLSPYTRRGYENIVAQVKDEIGSVQLQKLSTHRVQQMIADWQERGTSANRGPLSANTIRKHLICLSAAFNKACQLETMRKNPCKMASRPRVDRPEMRVLSLEQATRLMKETRESALHMPVFLGLTTGLRRGEIIGLRWQDVDVDNARIRVRQNAVQVKAQVIMKEPKTGKGRVVDLPAFVVTELRNHKKRQTEQRMLMGNRWKNNDLVCTMEDGRPMKPEWLSCTFGYFAHTRGFPVTFHGLRHTHATLLLRSGVHAKVIQERLGHSTIDMTLDTYSHLIEGMQQEAASKLEMLNIEPSVAVR